MQVQTVAVVSCVALLLYLAVLRPGGGVAPQAGVELNEAEDMQSSVRVGIQRDGPWFLGTCTGTKSSGAWMREWLELQILAGVGHVWVVNDNEADSMDATAAVLRYYVKIGYVTIIPGTMPLRMHGCQVLQGLPAEHNCAPVKYCFQHAAPHVKWLIFADSDEFIYAHNGCSLADHIRSTCNPDATHILVRWERFGTSNHVLHPQGLMTENFLLSGGSCRCSGPFTMCWACKQTKVIFNTECLSEEHAGWPHDIVNTSFWKQGGDKRWPKKRKWIESPGEGSNFKKDTCVFKNIMEDEEACNKWTLDGGFAKGYDASCCAAGIGYNHYGSKSEQYYWQKEMTVNVSKRGFRVPLSNINLQDFLSFSVLRYVASLKKRFQDLGIATSRHTRVLNTPNGNTCYAQHHVSIASKDSARYLLEGNPTPQSTCCELCTAEPACKAFTTENATCLLHLDLSNNAFNFPYHLKGTLRAKHHSFSGVPLRQGVC